AFASALAAASSASSAATTAAATTAAADAAADDANAADDVFGSDTRLLVFILHALAAFACRALRTGFRLFRLLLVGLAHDALAVDHGIRRRAEALAGHGAGRHRCRAAANAVGVENLRWEAQRRLYAHSVDLPITSLAFDGTLLVVLYAASCVWVVGVQWRTLAKAGRSGHEWRLARRRRRAADNFICNGDDVGVAHAGVSAHSGDHARRRIGRIQRGPGAGRAVPLRDRPRLLRDCAHAAGRNRNVPAAQIPREHVEDHVHIRVCRPCAHEIEVPNCGTKTCAPGLGNLLDDERRGSSRHDTRRAFAFAGALVHVSRRRAGGWRRHALTALFDSPVRARADAGRQIERLRRLTGVHLRYAHAVLIHHGGRAHALSAGVGHLRRRAGGR